MAGVAAADRTIPNLELLPDSVQDGYVMGMGAPPFNVIPGGYFAGDKFNAGDGQLVSGGDPLRFVFSLPGESQRQDDMNLKTFIWSANPAFTLSPTYLRRFGNGFGVAETSGHNETNYLQTGGKKYALELLGVDNDTIRVTLWEECGGDPIYTFDFAETGILTNPATMLIGWPTNEIIAGIAATDPLDPGRNYYTPNAHYPYMVRIHYAGPGNLGPTGATFVQETALSQAADLPAGTYVGYFVPEHALNIPCHAQMQNTAAFIARSNKLFTQVDSSALTLWNEELPIVVTDVFNLGGNFTSTGTLVVTA